MKLSVSIDQYLKSLISRNISPPTYREYSHYLAKFLEFCSDINVSRLNEQTILKYKHFLASYVDEGTGLSLKRVTQNYFLIALRSLIEYAREAQLTVLTKSIVPLAKLSPESQPPLDKKQIENVLNTPDVHTKQGLRDRAILETLFSSGLLVSELSYLNRDQIDLVGKQIKAEGRTGKTRTIFIFDRCAYWLEKYLASREDTFRPVFIRYQGMADEFEFGERMRLTPRSIERVVEKYAKATGIRGKVTPQSFRHFLGITLVAQGVSPQGVAEIMGYESSFSTRQYGKTLESAKEKS